MSLLAMFLSAAFLSTSGLWRITGDQLFSLKEVLAPDSSLILGTSFVFLPPNHLSVRLAEDADKELSLVDSKPTTDFAVIFRNENGAIIAISGVSTND